MLQAEKNQNGKRNRHGIEIKINADKRRKTERKLLKDHYPEIFAQIHESTDPTIDIYKLTFRSAKRLKWKCSNHTTCDEHVWEQSVQQRTRGKNCPFCNRFANVFCKCKGITISPEIDKKSIKIKSQIDKDLSNLDEKEVYDYCKRTFKLCSRSSCLKTMNLDKFNIHEKKIAKNCKECLCELTKRSNSIKFAMIKLFFQNRHCFDCGETDVVIFECDHVIGKKSTDTKGNTIKGLAHNSVSQLPIELKKCQVVCVTCHRDRTFTRSKLKRASTWTPTLIQSIILQVKLERKCCVHCSKQITQDNSHCFDFDHIDPKTKKGNISKMSDINLVYDEMKKCQLLCAACHRRKSSQNHRRLKDFSEDIIQNAKLNLGDLYLDSNKYCLVQDLIGIYCGASFRELTMSRNNSIKIQDEFQWLTTKIVDLKF